MTDERQPQWGQEEIATRGYLGRVITNEVPAPGPGAAPTCMCGTRITRATADGYGNDGCDDPRRPEVPRETELVDGGLYLVRPKYATEEREPVLAKYQRIGVGSAWEMAYFIYLGTDGFDLEAEVSVVQRVKVVPYGAA